jgi:hypothetical protein
MSFSVFYGPSYSRKVIEADGVTTTRHQLAPSVVKRLKTSYHMMILDSFHRAKDQIRCRINKASPQFVFDKMHDNMLVDS